MSRLNGESLFEHVAKFIQSNLSESSLNICVLLRFSTVIVAVWDSQSHVCGPALDWLCALRWWMAADCSDSLGTRLVCCVPHNGWTHRELTPRLFSVRVSAILLELFVWLLCWLCFDGDSGLFLLLCVFFSIVPVGRLLIVTVTLHCYPTASPSLAVSFPLSLHQYHSSSIKGQIAKLSNRI